MGELSTCPRGNVWQADISMGEVLAAEVSMGKVSVSLRTVHGRLKTISAPRDIIVVAVGWASCLISILELKLPLFSAYFLREHHQHFKLPTNSRFKSWHPPGPPKKGNHDYVNYGLVTFVERICCYANVDNSKVVVCFKQNSEEADKIGRYQWDESMKMCKPLASPQ